MNNEKQPTHRPETEKNQIRVYLLIACLPAADRGPLSLCQQQQQVYTHTEDVEWSRGCNVNSTNPSSWTHRERKEGPIHQAAWTCPPFLQAIASDGVCWRWQNKRSKHGAPARSPRYLRRHTILFAGGYSNKFCIYPLLYLYYYYII